MYITEKRYMMYRKCERS